MIFPGQQLPSDTDHRFCVRREDGHDLYIGVRRENRIPKERSGRRLAQQTHVRAFLWRQLDALYCGDSTQVWSLAKTEGGQPYLKGQHAPAISITHSREWIACAIAPEGFVGVDLEVLKPRDWETLIDQFIHPKEAQWVMSVKGSERDIRGYTCWCRKEAWLKALGSGLTVPLKLIAFSPEGRLLEAPNVPPGNRTMWRTTTWCLEETVVMTVAWTEDSGRIA